MKRLVGFVITFAVLGVYAMASNGPEIEGEKARPDRLLTEVEVILGIEPGNAAIGDALSDIAANLSHRPTSDEDLEKLVDKVLEGERKHLVLYEMLENVSVEHLQNNATSRLGYAQVLQIAKLLYTKARTQQVEQGERSVRYARAALILSTYPEFAFGSSGVQTVCKDRESFGKLANLTKEQAVKLNELIDRERKINEQKFEKLYQGAEIHDALLNSSDATLGSKTLAEALGIITRYRKEYSSDLYMQYQAIKSLWELLNLARVKGDSEATKTIVSFLKDWRTENSDARVIRWLDEALIKTGDKPRPAIVHMK